MRNTAKYVYIYSDISNSIKINNNLSKMIKSQVIYKIETAQNEEVSYLYLVISKNFSALHIMLYSLNILYSNKQIIKVNLKNILNS